MFADLTKVTDYATIIGASVGVAVFFGGCIAFSYKMWNKINKVIEQVTPNGGDSDTTGDRLLRVERHLATHIENDEAVQKVILDTLDALKPKPATRRRAVPK